MDGTVDMDKYLTVGGLVTANGGLTVCGTATLDSVTTVSGAMSTIGGDITVNGESTLNQVIVGSTLVVNGNLSASGGFSITNCIPTVPAPPASSDGLQIATTAWVKDIIQSLIGVDTNAAISLQALSNSLASDLTDSSGIATFVTIEANRATTAADNAETSFANAATKANNASTSATNASTSATNASTSATNASTSATNASGSASDAAGSSANASGSASDAADSATNAANSASAASGSASDASTSAAAAAQSAADALAAVAGFVDDDSAYATHDEVNRLDNQKLLFPSPSIYADATPMSLPSLDMVKRGVKGWYFKNDSTGKKINWYMPTTVGMKVSDIKGLYLDMFNGSSTNTAQMPFITVYTTKDDLTPNAASWYKSKQGYTVHDPNTTDIVANTYYTPFMNVSGSCVQPVLKSGYDLSNMIKNTDPGVSKGSFDGNETVFLISVGSASTAPINTVEFCVSKFGIVIGAGVQELVFVDDVPVSIATQTALGSKAPLANPSFTGNVTVSTGDIVLSSTSEGSGRIQFAARDSSGTVPYFMGVDANSPNDKLVIKKGTTTLMEISDAGFSGGTLGPETVTFNAPVIMTDFLDLKNSTIKLSPTLGISAAHLIPFIQFVQGLPGAGVYLTTLL